MKLDNCHIVTRLAQARYRLISERDRGTIGVTIDGTSQGEVMVQLVRGTVRDELTRRIAEIDEDLRALGVDVPADAVAIAA